jgi:hypothetical protein
MRRSRQPDPAVSVQLGLRAGSTTDIEAVREELFELLRLSPRLTTVIASDPSLLADEAYVSRNNPELADFLRSHPEVGRNPESYLFFPPNFPGEERRLRLDVPGYAGPRNDKSRQGIVALLVFVLLLAALLWIFRIVLENNKWNMLSRMQNDLYSKLLDKCATNEELLASFRTSAGRPFFDLAAIDEPRTASALSRVFLLLQFGIVLTVAGGGFQGFLSSRAGDSRLFLGLGTLVLALGIGLIISAVVSYLLARHLGLLPRPAKAKDSVSVSSKE